MTNTAVGSTDVPEQNTATASTLSARWRHDLSGHALRVALADGEDPRAVQAALRLHDDGVLQPRLIGRRHEVDRAARAADVAVPRELTLDIDVLAANADVVHALDETYAQRSHEDRAAASHDPVQLCAAALRAGLVDCSVAGASRPTADVLRAGVRTVGLRPGVRTLSSAFLMALPDGRLLTFADCAVVPDPSEVQLADIAVAAAGTHRALVHAEPRVAMLSFSTRGSAEHELVHRVRSATDRVRERMPGVVIDGELQFDAALVEAVSAHKAPGSAVAGQANVLVFPNLAAGNIGYKITERLGGALALGPILQGLDGALNDLSRGCSITDIETLALVSAVQALS